MNEETQVSQPPPPQTLSPADIPDHPYPDAGPEPAEITTEGIAQAAYAKLAEEMQWKGDFPVWEVISDRARASYVEAVEHVQRARANVFATQVAIGNEYLALQKTAEERIKAAEEAAKPRTRFEEIVVIVLPE